MSGRRVRIRHLLADLSSSETRGGALRRIRAKATSTLGRGGDGGLGTTAGSGARLADSRSAGEWRRLAIAVLGDDGSPGPEASAGPDIRKVAGRHRAEAILTQAIERGEPLEGATARAVAALAEQVQHRAAWALAEGVGGLPGGARASAIGHGVLHHQRGQFHRAWARFRDVDAVTLAATVPVEAVDGALADGSDEAIAVAMAVSVPDRSMEAAVAVDLAGRFLATGHQARAAELVGELRRRPAIELDEPRRHALALIEDWLEPATVHVPPGSIPIGILDYRSPDHARTSGNLGDYIQTLALVGNLARFGGVTITGEGGLGEIATELQGRVRADVRRPDVGGAAHLVPIDRDFSTGRGVPEGTWMIAFGSHLRSLFDLRYDFPYHPSIRPLFLSFHVNRLEMLSDEALAYLRAHGPVGCRDWTTVYLLLGAGVDAFFSGCLTSTVDSLFPARGETYHGGGAVGVIDQPASAAGRNARRVRTYGHQSDDYRYLSAADGLRAADRALAGYQHDLDRVVTGRLEAYLPLTSLGVPVEFRTRNPGDVRFAGLIGMQPGDPRLDEMRAGIRDLTVAVFEQILGGASESEVYDLWRERTAARVAEAKARFAEPVVDEPTTIDVAAAVAATAAGRRRFGPHESVDPATVTDVVLAYDQNLTTPAAVLIESIVTNASGPVRMWVLARGLTEAYEAWVGAAFPSLPITFLPCDSIGFGGTDGRPRRVPAHITVSTMDRLLLPDMLTEVTRVVYLDVDTMMFGDVCELAATDLGGHPAAARDSNVSEASQWLRAGRGLDEPLATELRRRVSHAHGFGHPALNAGVLVMDLDRMRRDSFTSTYLGWVERYGLHDQDTMLGYLGPRRGLVDPRWNVMPVLEDIAEPKLIHWATFNKPWDPELTFEKERWREVAARLRERAGDEPGGTA